MTLRPLDPQADRGAVAALFAEAADDLLLERGGMPDPEVVEDCFTSAPPGIDPATSLRLGLAGGEDGLLALIELAFGYPGEGDAYLGLMLLAPRARSRGLGPMLLAEVETAARARGKARLYLAVLDANPRARAFWTREGFSVHRTGLSVTLGQKTQPATRMVKPLQAAGISSSAR